MTKAELIKALEQFDDDMEVAYMIDESTANVVQEVVEDEDNDGKYILLIG